MIFTTFLKPGEHPLAALLRARGQAQGALAEVAEWSEYDVGPEAVDPSWPAWISDVTPTLYPDWHLLRVWVALPYELAESIALVTSLRAEEEDPSPSEHPARTS